MQACNTPATRTGRRARTVSTVADYDRIDALPTNGGGARTKHDKS